MPSLVMRWKDGGDWFTMPSMFNRAVLSAMDERESANDLTRLLRSYGYDVGEEQA
jgi:N-acetyl-anhydromuramyl-L-alanine amidase AmpD